MAITSDSRLEPNNFLSQSAHARFDQKFLEVLIGSVLFQSSVEVPLIIEVEFGFEVAAGIQFFFSTDIMIVHKLYTETSSPRMANRELFSLLLLQSFFLSDNKARLPVIIVLSTGVVSLWGYYRVLCLWMCR